MRIYSLNAKWRRTTHTESGESKKFPAVYDKLWSEICGNTGHMLDPKKWMSFSEIVLEHATYCNQFPETPMPSVPEIKIELEMLVILGMAEVKDES